jgi:CheY-like chemotaxis protein
VIVLDIGLPNLNGIEAAKRIREQAPESRILFMSQECDTDFVKETLNLGIYGYVAKLSAGRELLTGVKAVFRKERFISRVLASAVLNEGMRNVNGFHFEYNRENKIFDGKFHNAVTDESVATYYQLAAVQVAGADFRGGITDFSEGASSDVTPQAIRDLAALPPADPVKLRPRIVVAPNDQMFDLARLFQTLGRATRPNLHVVRHLREAYALLQVTPLEFELIEPGRLLDEFDDPRKKRHRGES